MYAQIIWTIVFTQIIAFNSYLDNLGKPWEALHEKPLALMETSTYNMMVDPSENAEQISTHI